VVRLVDATEKDLPLMMAWRSNPLVYQGFYQQDSPLVWEGHVQWFRERPSSWRSFIILYDERPVGGLNIGQLEYWEPEIGVYIGEVTLWGKGIAKEAVELGCGIIRAMGNSYTRTTILNSNKGSIRLFESLGYYKVGKARPGESLFRRALV